MNKLNPEIESHLGELCRLCCGALNGDGSVITDESKKLLKSLVMSGYARQQESTLQVELESRIKESCTEPAIHRGGAISGITSQLQKKFDELVRWESKQPSQDNPPQAANIDSATGA